MQAQSEDVPFSADDYTLLRDKVREMHTKIIASFPREDVRMAARQLGLLHKKAVVIKDRTHQLALCDYMIYSYRPRGFNLAERYLRLEGDGLDALSRKVLGYMSRARFSLFKLNPSSDNTAAPSDRVSITDLRSGESFLLVDPLALAQAGNSLTGRAVGAHLLFFDGFVMQSGNMAAAGREVLERIEQMPDFPQSQSDKLARAILSGFIADSAAAQLWYG